VVDSAVACRWGLSLRRRSIASIEPSDHPRVNFIDLAGAVIAAATVGMMQSHQNIPLAP
jgi:hypothetical protein